LDAAGVTPAVAVDVPVDAGVVRGEALAEAVLAD